MGKASNKKKSNKSACVNMFDLSALGNDLRAMGEAMSEKLKDHFYRDLFLAIKANKPNELKHPIEALLGLGVKVYSEEIFIAQGGFSGKIDIFHAAIVHKSGDVFTWFALDALKRDLLPAMWLRTIHQGPDETSFPLECKQLISHTFVVLMRESDLLNFRPETLELMKQNMGPNATSLLNQVLGEEQAKLDHEELLKFIPDVERESANEAEIAPRRKIKSI